MFDHNSLDPHNQLGLMALSATLFLCPIFVFTMKLFQFNRSKAKRRRTKYVCLLMMPHEPTNRASEYYSKVSQLTFPNIAPKLA